jgi:hypothetical protein
MSFFSQCLDFSALSVDFGTAPSKSDCSGFFEGSGKQQFGIELMRMESVPDLDSDGSGSDVLVKAILLNANGQPLGYEVSWPGVK